MNLSWVSRFFSAAAILALAIILCQGTAEAQFSGPGLGSGTAINNPVAITTDPAILYPAEREIRLGAGDTIQVRVSDAPEYAAPVRVAVDGTISLPYIGILTVQDLTVHQAEQEIARRLVSGNFYVNPQVTIQVTESPNQIVTVLGEIHVTAPIVGRRRLYDALSLAGGLPPTASHIIHIERPGLDQPIVVDLGIDPAKSSMANVPVFAGDTIIVSRVGSFYTLGAFRSQGVYPLTGNSPVTLLQAIAMSGGPNFEGKREQARIIRTSGIKRFEVKVNMSRVMKGKDPDPVLQADDIVYLPSSALKAAIRAGGIATLLGFANVVSYTAFR